VNIAKPTLDISMFYRRLAQVMGWEAPTFLICSFAATAFIIRLISPAFGKLVAIQQKLEGEYRGVHNDLIVHSEEVAFLKGIEWEKKKIDKKYDQLINHNKHVLHKKFQMGVIDSMLVKYGAVMSGYAAVGMPVFGRHREAYLASIKNDPKIITKDYVRNSGLLINLAKAIGRVVVSYKDIQNLAGYTTLVHEMDEVLGDLSQAKYHRTMVTQSGETGAVKEKSLENNDFTDKGTVRLDSDSMRF
jgi:ATP-binding cassette subfamily D (ALD) protein 3